MCLRVQNECSVLRLNSSRSVHEARKAREAPQNCLHRQPQYREGRLASEFVLSA